MKQSLLRPMKKLLSAIISLKIFILFFIPVEQPETVLEIIEREKVTIGICVATMLRMIMKNPKFETSDFSSLRWLFSAGASTPDDILNAYWGKNIKLVKGYGMTEAGPNNTAMDPDSMTMEEVRKKGASVGRPMIFNQVKILNDQGELVKQGEVGELIWGGNLVFSGYWNNPAETEHIFEDGWIRTGDLGRQDEDGHLYIVGRKKNMYISGGEKIYPLEIENVMNSYPGINETVVIGVKDQKWGEVGKAIIETERGIEISIEELTTYIKKKLGTLKTPKYFEFIEKIPKNTSGKVEMATIIEQFGSVEKVI